jgi:hypothetical protein
MFNYQRQHTQEWVTDGFIKYLKEDYLVFRVYGFAEIKKKQTGDKSTNKMNLSNNTSSTLEQSTIDMYD